MKVLVTTHAQMFRAPDESIWTSSVYGYDFFTRYLEVFDEVRLVTRMKDITFEETGDKLRVDGKGMEFFRMPFYRGPWEYISRLPRIQLSLSRAISDCDCAILRIPDQLAFQLFNKVKSFELPCAIEVVAHSWDFFAPGTMKTVLRPFLRVYWDYLQKKVCKTADGVAYVTENYIQKRYPSRIYGNDSRRFETFYTSASLHDAFLVRPREAHEFQKERLTLVHVSGINNAAKGHHELLHSLSTLKERGIIINAIFVGGGTMYDYYKNLASKLGLSEQVTFLGHIMNPKEIVEVLTQSDIFVLPTRTEGLPRVILEAMACGLPVIATRVGGIPELLSDRCLVEIGNPEALADKIIEFSRDINLLHQQSYNNYYKILDSFSCEKVQNKRKRFYSELKSKV